MTHPLVHALVELGSEPPKPTVLEGRTTKEVVAAMLTENTGRHMLDSGGAYGRNWEQNQHRNFDAEPEVTVDWRYGFIDVSLNVYHFLVNTVDYEEELDLLFERWSTAEHHKRENWFTCIEDFVEAIQWKNEWADDPEVVRFREEIEGIGNPYTGGHEPWTINTYNGEDLLSQVLQYTMLGDLVFMQVHGGCDVRGGYTQPRVFRFSDNSYPSLLDNALAALYCNSDDCAGDKWGQRTRWFTDDGYHWYFMDSYSEDLPDTQVDISEPEGMAKLLVERAQRELEEEHPTLFETDEVFRMSENFFVHTEDNYAVCPVCLKGHLEGSYY